MMIAGVEGKAYVYFLIAIAHVLHIFSGREVTGEDAYVSGKAGTAAVWHNLWQIQRPLVGLVEGAGRAGRLPVAETRA